MSTQLLHRPSLRSAPMTETPPRSQDLGRDIQRLCREELEAIDRRRQEALARLRRLQDQD